MASPFLWLGFGLAQQKVKFHPFRDEYPNFDDMFEPFPFTSPEPLLEVPHPPRINNDEGLPRKLSFEQALSWGDGIDSESSIFFPAFYGEGDEQNTFCVKVLFNTEKAQEDDYCLQAIHDMLADANFYGHNLRDVAGILVPRHYGVWRARTGKWGGTILCSVTEWAGIPWDKVAARKGDTTTVKKIIGRTIERLHDHSIHHNRLNHANDLHHLLLRVDKTDAGPITRCFVVDFSKAMTVPCTRNLPILPIDANILEETGGCEEALNLTFLLRMFENGVEVSSSTQMYRAIRFYDQYSAQHPSLDNAAVMMVQRHHFFADDPPLEPDIRFGFLPDGKVVFDMKDSEPLAKRLPEDYVTSLLS
ncbi:hypothetical protein BDZ89DRAFT_1169565 [Hymenopellis radicata]|nr:hypothetical protein BDZ89DRAFT_1169565 [Hymenopellis radicata]